MRFLGRDHSREAILPLLKESGDQLIAMADLSVFVPFSFTTKGLLYVDGTVVSVGYMALSTDTHYAYYNIPAMITLGQCEINETSVDEVPFYEFKFKKGDILFASLDLVQQDSLIYMINDEMIAKGKIPSFQDYEHVHNIMMYTQYYTGVTVGATGNTMDYFYSIIGRKSSDPSVQFRNDPTGDVTFIPFRSIALTANNTLTKIAGSYMDAGIDSALVNKTEVVHKTEEMLRT